MALELGPSDEVIVPSLSFVATANAVLAAGFTPKFVDVKLESFNIDTNKIEDQITDKTRAIMPVHLMGKPCEMDTILKIAKNILTNQIVTSDSRTLDQTITIVIGNV